MDKKHIITIAGRLGSGKSSTANKVAELLKYNRASTGDFMRSIANEKGISLEELSVIAETDPSIDKALDDHNLEIGKKDNIVLDSRLGFYFLPESFKVFLELNPQVAAERILKDSKLNPNRHKETKASFNNVENIIASIEERMASERKRYKDLYGITNHTSPENFNLVIDTENISLDNVASKIIEEYQKWLTK